MFPFHRPLVFAASACMTVLPLPAANVIDSIHNPGAGSFEIPDPNITSYETFFPGDPDIGGWQVVAGSVDWVRSTVWNASQGAYSIDMNGTAPSGDPPSVGSIRTMVSTTIGTTYRLTFDVSGYNGFGNGTNPKELEVSVKAVDLLGDTAEISNTHHQYFATNNASTLPLAISWESRTVLFTATQATTTLTFISRTTDNHSGILLDNVVLEAIPEPSAAMIAFLGGCLLLKRKRDPRG